LKVEQWATKEAVLISSIAELDTSNKSLAADVEVHIKSLSVVKNRVYIAPSS